MGSESWWRGQKGEWYVVFQFVLFGIVFAVPLFWPTVWTGTWRTMGIVLGLILAGVGGVLVLMGLMSLGRNLTAVPYPKDDAQLVRTGAYRIVRHPIYSGIILGSFGWALWQNSVITILLSVALFIFFDVKSRREERWLADKFGDYGAYQQQVRKLIPFIY